MKFLLLFLKGAPLGKFAFSAGTLFLSVIAYAQVFGWRYAAGFVALLFFHELGHYIAARQRSLSVGLPVFVPFVGAWIALKEAFPDAESEAWTGMGGPLLGSLAALGCYCLARHTDSSLLLAVAYSGFILNLFNLIPIPPLDGGHITMAISPKIWLVGIPFLAGFYWFHPNPLLLVVCVIAGAQLWARRRVIIAPEKQLPYDKRLEYAVLYFGLIAWLSLMVWSLHHELAMFR